MTNIGAETRSRSWQAETQVETGLSHIAPIPQAALPRRRQVRFGVRQLLTHSPVFGRAVEVSASGLRLESHATLPVGGDFVFRLNYGARYLNLPGRVAWCLPHRVEATALGLRTIYQAGIELRPGDADASWRAAMADRAGVAVGV